VSASIRYLRLLRFLCLSSSSLLPCFFFTDPAITELYTLSLHDALPIFGAHAEAAPGPWRHVHGVLAQLEIPVRAFNVAPHAVQRSEEHTSELQSRENLVCRLLLEKKKKEEKNLRPVYNHRCIAIIQHCD